MKSPWIRVIGGILTIAAVAYVLYQLSQSSAEILDNLGQPASLAATAVAGILYAFLAVLIAVAWHLLHQAVSPDTLPLRRSIIIFGKSQFLKYLPSNVVHVAGRYALARTEMLPHAAIAVSTIAELVLVTATAVILAIILANDILLRFVGDEQAGVILSAMILAGIVFAALVGLLIVLRKRNISREAARRIVLAAFASVLLYAAFFLLNGFLVGGISYVLSEQGAKLHLSTLGLVAAAWTVGFLVPGAPAGLGVREAVLVAGLELLDVGAPAVAIALAYRIATLLGDGLFALAATLADRRMRPGANGAKTE